MNVSAEKFNVFRSSAFRGRVKETHREFFIALTMLAGATKSKHGKERRTTKYVATSL
jgi:hypothetical protein